MKKEGIKELNNLEEYQWGDSTNLLPYIKGKMSEAKSFPDSSGSI